MLFLHSSHDSFTYTSIIETVSLGMVEKTRVNHLPAGSKLTNFFTHGSASGILTRMAKGGVICHLRFRPFCHYGPDSNGSRNHKYVTWTKEEDIQIFGWTDIFLHTFAVSVTNGAVKSFNQSEN